LIIPDLPPEASTLDWANAYAKAGIYVLPVKRGTKHPGSVVGMDWQHGKSSIDPKVIAAWFMGTDYDIALDLGRSGLVAIDMDHIENMPDGMHKHLNIAAYQASRDLKIDPGRGHYLFEQPEGRRIGCATGRLGGGWGEVRGVGGVIMAQPSFHCDGGEYRWIRTAIPVLPVELAEKLDDAGHAEASATPAEVQEFIDRHTAAAVPTVMSAWQKIWADHMLAGDSRHTSAVSVVTGALKEAAAGLFSAQVFLDWFEPEFITAKTRPPINGEFQMTASRAREVLWGYGGIIAWAVAQASTADVADTLERTHQKTPSPKLKRHIVDLEEQPESDTVRPEPFDLGEPRYSQVRGALRKKSNSRMGDMLRLCGACHRAGLELPQFLFVLQEREDLTDVDYQQVWDTITAPEVEEEPEPPRPQHVPISLQQCRAVFTRWLGETYDTDVLDVMFATNACEKLNGDPVWLMVISGPGFAKTETVQSCSGDGALVTSTIQSEGALLSATSESERSKDATGGLLRKIKDSGVIVIKDFTSIITMDRTARGQVLSALREIYDGKWERNVGVDGGRSIPWTGRLVVIGACTTAWDKAHTVVAAMGDRFVLCRLDSGEGRQSAGRQAMRNVGDEVTMRAELAAAVGGVMASINLDTAPLELNEDEQETLLAAADLITLARTAVEFDYRGNVEMAHAPEAPTRFLKQLVQIVRGAMSLGMDRKHGMKLAMRCGRDSMPPTRLAIIDDVAAHPHSTTGEVRKRIDLPRSTVDRQLQALHHLGVLTCDEVVTQWIGGRYRPQWYYSLAEGINPDTVAL